MNNLSSFWFAPITAIFDPNVYRAAAKSSGGRGVLYNLYLSFFSVVALVLIMSLVAMPKVNQFVDWMKKSMPVMIWTPEGLSLENGQTTYTMDYPGYGPVAQFDMTKTAVTEQDMGKAFLFVTQTKLFVKKQAGEMETRDITKAGIQSKQQLPSRVRITSELVGSLFQNIKRILMLFLPILGLILIFIFNLLTSLFYSLAGLLFNQVRANRLGYGAIFNLTSFALTVTWLLMWLRMLPAFQAISFPWWAGAIVNLAYLYFAFKSSDETPGEALV